nr:hypothetical protein [Holzapfeliella floricola]
MRSKKIVAEMSGVLALLIAVVMMLVNQPHIKAATVDEVKAKGELVMGTAPDYPPMNFGNRRWHTKSSGNGCSNWTRYCE